MGDKDGASTDAVLPASFGKDWTPSPEQIAAARRRHSQWRADEAVQWHKVTDLADIAEIRIAVVTASIEARGNIHPDEVLRMLRVLALDEAAQFYERKLQVLPALRLVEFRHDKLRVPGGQAPVGFRFLRVTREHWRKWNFVGLYLDGRSAPTEEAFKEIFTSKNYDYPPSLIEHYISFAFDHVRFEGSQLYVVRDHDDLILPGAPLPGPDKPDIGLTAQFRVVALPGAGNASVAGALRIPEAALIPPTLLRQTDEYGAIFATIVLDKQLFHVGLKVFKDGAIKVERGCIQQRTNTTDRLPLVALRSLNDQRAALENAMADASAKDVR